jgi:hypothetical protein
VAVADVCSVVRWIQPRERRRRRRKASGECGPRGACYGRRRRHSRRLRGGAGAQQRRRAARVPEGTGWSWWYRLAAATGAVRGWRRHSQAATGKCSGGVVSSWAKGEGAGGASWQRLAKYEGVQGWTMWVSRPLGHALHSISLLRWKRFLGVSIGRSFPFGCAGPTEEHCPLFLMYFSFREKSSRVSRRLFLSPFARRVFGRTVRADCFSFRRVRPIWRGGAGARGVVAVLKWAVGKSGARQFIVGHMLTLRKN